MNFVFVIKQNFTNKIANCQVMLKSGICFRWLLGKDIEEVLLIESSLLDSWDSIDIVEELSNRESIGFILEIDGNLLGYVFYRLYKDYIEIVRFGVKEDYRRIGVGGYIFHKIGCKLKISRNRILLRVDESNLICHLFLRSMGYICYGTEGSDYLFEYTKIVQ